MTASATCIYEGEVWRVFDSANDRLLIWRAHRKARWVDASDTR